MKTVTQDLPYQKGAGKEVAVPLRYDNDVSHLDDLRIMIIAFGV